MAKEDYRPIGSLAEMLARYEAPKKVQTALSRRAGALVGPTIPVATVETVIERSMEYNRGLPHWGRVNIEVGGIVTDSYKKLKRIF